MNTNTTIKEHLVYKIFGLKVPDYSNLVIIEKINFYVVGP